MKYIQIISLSLALTFGMNLHAQQAREEPVPKASQELTKAEKKQKKKKARKARRMEERQEVMNLLESQRFVLEAHTLVDRYGRTYPLNPSINFVMLDSTDAVIQLGFSHLVGWNGLGGITLESRLDDLRINEPKKKTQYPTALIRTVGSPMGLVTINLFPGSQGSTRATINGNFGERLTLIGNMVPLEQSGIFQGQTTFFY